MKKIKDLEINDFPGVNPGKFQEWKNLQKERVKRAIIATPILIVLWFIFLYLSLFPRMPILPTVLVIIGFISISAYVLGILIKIFKLQKELGITHKDIRDARKK